MLFDNFESPCDFVLVSTNTIIFSRKDNLPRLLYFIFTIVTRFVIDHDKKTNYPPRLLVTN